MQRVVRYRALAVRVETSSRSDLEWLLEFLRPGWEVSDDGRFDYAVSLRRDTRRTDEIRQAMDRRARSETACFLLDTRVVRHPGFDDRDGRRWIHDREFDVYYAVDPARARTTILGSGQNRQARLALMRVVRELSMCGAPGEDVLVIHGAAFLLGGRAVILAGRKNTGKTSLLMHALQHPATRYVSNDRVVVAAASTGFTAHGMASIVSVRAPTLRWFPAVRHRLEARHYAPAYRLVESPPGPTPAWRRRYTLSPAQFCRLVDSQPAGHGPLAAIVFPELTHDQGTRLESLDRTAGVQRLLHGLFRAGARAAEAGIFGLTANGSREPADHPVRSVTRVVERVPCVVARMGLDGYESMDWVHGLERLIASA